MTIGYDNRVCSCSHIIQNDRFAPEPNSRKKYTDRFSSAAGNERTGTGARTICCETFGTLAVTAVGCVITTRIGSNASRGIGKP